MNDFRSWRPRYRALCPDPGPEDLFVVILVEGKRVALHPAADHARWRGVAERFAESQRCQVKVLPMTGDEAMNFYGIKLGPPQPIGNMDPAFREQAVKNCMDVLRECGSPDDRELALKLLGQLGVLSNES